MTSLGIEPETVISVLSAITGNEVRNGNTVCYLRSLLHDNVT
jgi:hypothetical protein